MTNSDKIKNPFPGLRPFKPEESHLFFGRDGQSDELLDRLEQNRFLAVVGTSGSGKSSLVRAGLLPIVHGGFIEDAGSNWRVVLLRPGDNPIKNLAKELSKPGVLKNKNCLEEDYNDISDQNLITETVLRRGSLGLVEIFRQSRLPEGENLLIVVDQFEELFRFKGSVPDEDAAFVKLLLKSVQQKEVPIYVVITMRSEFLGDCAQFRDLPEAINNSQYLIPRMTRKEKREAIVGPIAVGGAKITPALVTRLLNDVRDKPDQLPILQHALMRTWDKWAEKHKEGEPLDLKHYEAIGTMDKALSQHAEEAYKKLNKRNRTICEKMFKLLTDPGKTGQGVRRPTKVSEICSVTEASEKEVIKVINSFRQPGRTFLMPPIEVSLNADSVIDISHESLMRIWDTLDKWVEEEKKDAELYRRLANDAELHEIGEKREWGDPELGIALKWWEETDFNKAWADRYDNSYYQTIRFLVASKKQQRKDIEEREKQREREIRDKQKIRELEIKRREEQIRRKRTRVFSIIISIAAVIAILLTVWALDRNREFLRQKRIAEVLAGIAKRNEFDAKKKSQEILKQKEEVNKKAIEARNAREKAEKNATAAKLAKIKAEENERKAEKEKQIAEEESLNARINELIVDLDKEKEKSIKYRATAEKVAVQSIAQTGNKKRKTLLALAAYQLNKKAYIYLGQSTQNIFKKFDENILDKYDRKTEIVDSYTEFKEKYEGFQKESKKINEPIEIFKALRNAYIAIEDSKDKLDTAESWALTVTGDNKIVFNNPKGELSTASLQPNQLKLPVLGPKETFKPPENTILWANSIIETEDRLFCITREEGSIIYWHKNNREKSTELVKRPDPVLAMAYSKNKKWLIYSIKNTIYRHNLIGNTEPKVVKKDVPFPLFTLIEDDKNSFLIYAVDKPGSKEKVEIYSQSLSDDGKEEERLIANLDSGSVHTIASDQDRKWLVLGNDRGEIHISKIEFKSLKNNTKLQFDKIYEKHKGIVRALAFSPGGRYLASGGLDGNIMLWDLEGGKTDKIAGQPPILRLENKLKVLSITFALIEKEEYMIFSDVQNLRICPTSPETFYNKLCTLRKEKDWEFTPEEWGLYIGKTIKPGDLDICSPGK